MEKTKLEDIFNEVLSEIVRSEHKHGNQDSVPVISSKFNIHLSADAARRDCDASMADKTVTHAHIISEEFHEFVEADTAEELRKELVQLACVCVKAIKAFDNQHKKFEQPCI
jgi:hypothetical protein